MVITIPGDIPALYRQWVREDLDSIRLLTKENGVMLGIAERNAVEISEICKDIIKENEKRIRYLGQRIDYVREKANELG